MGTVKTSQIEPNNGVDLNLISGPGGYVYVNGQIITGSGSVIIGPKGDMGPTGSIGDTGATGATGPKGDTGEQGIPGIDGAVLPAGLTWSGTWSGTQSYLKNYVVGYASASWWSKNNIEGKPFPLTPNSPPDIDNNNWALLATQGPVGPIGPIGPQGLTGPTGIGLQGIQGIQGPTGAAGPGVASQVSYTPFGLTLTANTVQGAIDQLDTLITDDNVSTQKNPTDPTVTSSTVGVMMGLSASITPVLSGKIMIIISGDMDNDTNSRGARVQIRTGTGTPPINGAALTGTAQGGLVSFEQNNLSVRTPFSLNAIQNGLTLNTAVWIDISLTSITGGISRVRDISMSIVEL